MKHRRNGVIQRSISVKLNILIVTMILIVSALLILISDRTYRRTVLETSAQKLNSVEVTEDAFVPVSDHFSKVFQTDAFREAKAKSKSGAAKDGHPAEKAWKILDSMVQEGALDGEMLARFRESRAWGQVAEGSSDGLR